MQLRFLKNKGEITYPINEIFYPFNQKFIKEMVDIVQSHINLSVKPSVQLIAKGYSGMVIAALIGDKLKGYEHLDIIGMRDPQSHSHSVSGERYSCKTEYLNTLNFIVDDFTASGDTMLFILRNLYVLDKSFKIEAIVVTGNLSEITLKKIDKEAGKRIKFLYCSSTTSLKLV